MGWHREIIRILIRTRCWPAIYQQCSSWGRCPLPEPLAATLDANSLKHTFEGLNIDYPRIDETARYVARLVQGSQILEGAGLDAAGYERLIAYAKNHIREKWDAEMLQLIERWEANARDFEAAKEQALNARRQTYGNHYRSLTREQRRDFDRLTNEANEFGAKATVYRECAESIRGTKAVYAQLVARSGNSA